MAAKTEQGNEACIHWPSSVLRGSQVYKTGAARVYTFPKIPNCGEGQGGEKGIDIKSRFQGSSSKVFWPLSSSSQAAKENGKRRVGAGGGDGRQGGRRGSWEGVQAAATSGYVATSVFRLLEKKIPPPNHTTPLSLFDTKFQDPEKTQSASSSFWGRGLAIGSLFLQKLG